MRVRENGENIAERRNFDETDMKMSAGLVALSTYV